MSFLTETLGILDYLFQKYEYKEVAAEDMKRDPVKELPLEIIYQIFSSLNARELTNCCFVSRDWHLIASDPLLWNTIHHARAFGKALLEKTFDCEIEEEPRLPPNLHEVLSSPCPFNKEKKVGQTHRLALMSRLINDFFYHLADTGTNEMSKVKNFPKCEFHTNHEIKEKPMELSSYWVLMTKELVDQKDPDINYSSRQDFLLNCNRNASIEYRFPRPIEAIVWIIMDDLKPKRFWGNLFPQTSYNLLCEERFEQNKKIYQLYFDSQTNHFYDEFYCGKIIAVHELGVL